MTAARRAAPKSPTVLQRLRTRLAASSADERLVSDLEDHVDRLHGYAARADTLGQHWVAVTHRRDADDVRRILARRW